MEPVPDLSKGRARKVWIWAAAALVLVSIAVVLWWSMRRGRRVEARRRVVEAWARFERCLIGPPLAAGESARERVRRIWLASPTPAEGLGPKEREGLWPTRCARYLDAVWSDAGESGLGERVTDVFAKASSEVKGSGEPGKQSSFDDLFAAIAKAGVPLGADARVPFPPEPVKPFRRAELASLGSGQVVTWARREDGGVWRFLLDGRSLCEVDLAAAAGGCASIAFTGGSDAHVELAAGDPGAPPVIIVSKQGKEGVYEVGPPDATGARPLTRLHAGVARGAYARGSGAVDLLVGDERGYQIVRLRGGKETERLTLRLPRPPVLRSVHLVDDAVVWLSDAVVRESDTAGAQPLVRLWRLELPASRPLGGPRHLGDLPAATRSPVRGCRQGDTRAILVGGASGPSFVVVGRKDVWGTPQPVDATGFPVLSCRNAGAILTWKTLRRVRCTNAECAADGVTLALADESVGADIGERGAIAHGQALHGGRPGGVRVRVGPVEGLHGAPDRLLLDDGEDWHDGADPATLYLLGGADAGLLLVPTVGDGHLFAFRVAPDGAVTPVQRK